MRLPAYFLEIKPSRNDVTFTTAVKILLLGVQILSELMNEKEIKMKMAELLHLIVYSLTIY